MIFNKKKKNRIKKTFKIDKNINIEEYKEEDKYNNMDSEKVMIFKKEKRNQYIGIIFYSFSKNNFSLLEIVNTTNIKDKKKLYKEIKPIINLNNELDKFDCFFLENAKIDEIYRGRGFFKKTMERIIKKTSNIQKNLFILFEIKNNKRLKDMYIHIFSKILFNPLIYLYKEQNSLFFFIMEIRVKR